MSGLRGLPSVERLAGREELAYLAREAAVQAARGAIDEARAALRRGGEELPEIEALAARAAARADAAVRPTLRRAINATGVLLHTNLGRATLAPLAAQAVADVAAGHATLEVDEATGGRGSRQAAVGELLRVLTGGGRCVRRCSRWCLRRSRNA